MAKGGRPKSKGKGKQKASTHQPDVVGLMSPRTGSTHVIEQTIDSMDPIQPVLGPAGVKLAAFMKTVEQETALATKNLMLNKQQSFDAIQTMLHVSVSCSNSCTLGAILTPAVRNS